MYGGEQEAGSANTPSVSPRIEMVGNATTTVYTSPQGSPQPGPQLVSQPYVPPAGTPADSNHVEPEAEPRGESSEPRGELRGSRPGLLEGLIDEVITVQEALPKVSSLVVMFGFDSITEEAFSVYMYASRLTGLVSGGMILSILLMAGLINGEPSPP